MGEAYSYAASTERVDGVKRMRLLHREILGVDSSSAHVDHINHDTLDNRRSNLRVVTNAENRQNLRPRKGRLYRGVFFDARAGKWRAQSRLNGKKYNLGCFATEAEAGMASAAWRAENMPFSVEALSR